MLESPVLKDCLQLYNYILKIIWTIKEYLMAGSEVNRGSKARGHCPNENGLYGKP